MRDRGDHDAAILVITMRGMRKRDISTSSPGVTLPLSVIAPPLAQELSLARKFVPIGCTCT
jgi:hypothetical protein